MATGTLVSSGSSGSMPTGSGSERLCRATITVLNNDTQTILSGTAGHIYTILSIIFCDRQSAAGTVSIAVNNGGADVYIISVNPHSANDTFVFSDRLVIEEDDDLIVTNSVTNGAWIVSYIDQNWV